MGGGGWTTNSTSTTTNRTYMSIQYTASIQSVYSIQYTWCYGIQYMCTRLHVYQVVYCIYSIPIGMVYSIRYGIYIQCANINIGMRKRKRGGRLCSTSWK